MTARGKAKEISLQVEIESQEDWEENLAKEGLLIIDVYQEWCGPCKSMVPIFRRIKNESGDDLLRFAIAKADSVEALDRYRGKCEPKFLFYAGGLLVEVIHGADSPALARSITHQLENEKKVAEGSVDRKEIIDPKFPTSKRKTLKDAVTSAFEDTLSSIGSSDEEEMEERRSDSHMRFGGENIVLSDIDGEIEDSVLIEKECAIMIIYPDVVADGKVRDIITKLKTNKFDVLDELEKELTEEQVQDFFGGFPEYNDNFKTFMMSSAIFALLLTKGEFGERIFSLVQEAIGPVGVSIGKQDAAPNSLRANYLKTDSPFAGFYSSGSSADAKKEIPKIFSTYVSKKVSLTNIQTRVEHITIVVIRPAILERLSAIFETIATLDFKVVMQQQKQFSQEEVEKYFLSEYLGADEAIIEELYESMNKPCMILVLSNGKDTVVDDWLRYLGPPEPAIAFQHAPSSFRGRFGQRDSLITNFEASLSIDNAEKEFFRYFPTQQTVLLIKPDAYEQKDEIMNLLRKKGFFVSGRKDIQFEREQAEEIYIEKAKEIYFEDLINYMTSGPSCLMILSKYNAIEEAFLMVYGTAAESTISTSDIEEEPTLRNVYGTDELKNGVGVTPTAAAAKADIKKYWGDVRFDDDGTMKKKKKVKRETVCEAKGKFTTKEGEGENDMGGQENNTDDQIDSKDEKIESQILSESKQDKRSESKLSQPNNADASRPQSKNQDASRPQSKNQTASRPQSKASLKSSTPIQNRPPSAIVTQPHKPQDVDIKLTKELTQTQDDKSPSEDKKTVKSNKSADAKKNSAISTKAVIKKPLDQKKNSSTSNTTKTSDKNNTATKSQLKRDTVKLSATKNVDKNLNITVENKKEKSTDCDSALIPLLCVHG